MSIPTDKSYVKKWKYIPSLLVFVGLGPIVGFPGFIPLPDNPVTICAADSGCAVLLKLFSQYTWRCIHPNHCCWAFSWSLCSLHHQNEGFQARQP